jgi:uncharacterized protein (DUF1778 family)
MGTAVMTKSQRLAVRLTGWQKTTIERAAAVTGGSITDFAVQALVDRAQEILADRPAFEVGPEAWAEFNRLLDEPATPIPGMVDLLARPTVFDQ